MNRTIIAALFFHHPENLDKQAERQRLPTLLSLRVLNAESQPQPEQRAQYFFIKQRWLYNKFAIIFSATFKLFTSELRNTDT